MESAILVVDDYPAVRSVVKAVLESAGYGVITANDGLEALELLEDPGAAIALLLTDVEMPEMNGIDLAHRALERRSALPILFMSSDSIETRGATNGFACISKPFKCEDLLGKVSESLGNSSPMPQVRRPAADHEQF